MTSWTVSIDLKHTEASFSPSSVDSLCLRVARMPRSPDLAIFVPTTDYFTPCACARGITRSWWISTLWCGGQVAEGWQSTQGYFATFLSCQTFIRTRLHINFSCRAEKGPSTFTWVSRYILRALRAESMGLWFNRQFASGNDWENYWSNCPIELCPAADQLPFNRPLFGGISFGSHLHETQLSCILFIIVAIIGLPYILCMCAKY